MILCTVSLIHATYAHVLYLPPIHKSDKKRFTFNMLMHTLIFVNLFPQRGLWHMYSRFLILLGFYLFLCNTVILSCASTSFYFSSSSWVFHIYFYFILFPFRITSQLTTETEYKVVLLMPSNILLGFSSNCFYNIQICLYVIWWHNGVLFL